MFLGGDIVQVFRSVFFDPRRVFEFLLVVLGGHGGDR